MKKLTWILTLLLFVSTTSFSQNEARLLRFPTIHGNQIVFTYAGDLYSVTKSGGVARKLTSDKGFEMFAKISPNGKLIAFTGQFDGNTEVYVMPAKGGQAKRLTYTATLSRDDVSDRMGPNNMVVAWTPDSKNIIYRSRKQSFNSFIGQLFSVSVNGGLSKELPLATGGFCSYSPDGKKLAFNQVMREFRTWKYYRGGMADDIRIFDFDTKQVTKITDNPAQDIFPMWWDNTIYFMSDRDRIMNLFAYNQTTKTTKKVTDFTEYDCKFPSIGDGQIVFENAGYIYVFDIATQKATKVSIQINDDFEADHLQMKNAYKSITAVSPSPAGERLAFAARGDIFDVPGKEGITYNLTKTSNAHERSVKWSPDGKYIAYISDISGEFEIWMVKADHSEKPVQLTKNADTYYFNIEWSPDSKKILWNDKKMRLQYVDITTKKVTLIIQSKLWEISNFNWSPDSKWITYARQTLNHFNVIYLYNLETKQISPVTEDWFNSSSPVFSRNGKYLFFISRRSFNPIYSNTEWNHAYIDMSKIYFLTLAKDTKSPLALTDDSVKPENTTTNADKSKNNSKEKTNKTPTVKIDIDGISQRIDVLPVKASNYWSIQVVNNKVYYNEKHFKGKTTLNFFDLKKKKKIQLGENLFYQLTPNGKKFIIRKNKQYFVIDIPKGKINLTDVKPVNTKDMRVLVDLHAEWNQIYNEGWRQMRDFFYMKNMNGVNWKAIHDKYQVLVPYVNCRKDLTYIMGEMIGELTIGHAYVGGGDVPKIDKIYTGLLGAKLSRDKSGFFKIDKILKGENWYQDYRSPLTAIGVDVKEGDYIIAIDHTLTNTVDDIYKLLIDKANKPVEIGFSSTPDNKNVKTAVVKPVATEKNLYYYNWVQHNIKLVSEKTNGQVGYIHIPDMMSEGLNEFVKYFYPQLDKRALIIDDRGNGGGNVSPMIIERLRRAITRANISRNQQIPDYTPEQAFVGPKVLLINQYSASDGDLFPYGFKEHKLGKVIGVRSWGGVTGIRGPLPFVDGGYLYKPEFASYSAEKSKWIIEGHGVDPDIVVENNPYKEYMGEDAQLNKAIEVITEELKKWPVNKVPPVPPAPDKSK